MHYKTPSIPCRLAGCVKGVVLAALVIPMVGNVTEARKPNVIVILADDLGYADLGCHGSKDVKTPHIDSLSANGVRFTNGYVTSPQCGPSRVGLLTGRYQNRFGFESNEFARRPAIPLSEKLISDRMKAAGYATGYSGKWGVGHPTASGPEYVPPGRGFDETYWNSDGNIRDGGRSRSSRSITSGSKGVNVNPVCNWGFPYGSNRGKR